MPSLLRRLAALAPENRVYLPADALFQLPEELIELLKGPAPHEPAPEVVLRARIHRVYAPTRFPPLSAGPRRDVSVP